MASHEAAVVPPRKQYAVYRCARNKKAENKLLRERYFYILKAPKKLVWWTFMQFYRYAQVISNDVS